MDIVSVPGRLVRDPVTRRVVDDTPITVNPTEPYWARLLADGDVAEAQPPASDPNPAVAPTQPTSAPAKPATSSQDASA